MRGVRDDLLDTIQSALTRSFRSAYLVSALFALLALIPVAVAWRRAIEAGAPAQGAAPGRASGSLGGLLAAAVLLVGVEVAAGGVDLGRSTIADPCTTTTERSRGGFDATLQGVVLDGLAGAACDLGVTREELVLSFGGSDARPHGRLGPRDRGEGRALGAGALDRRGRGAAARSTASSPRLLRAVAERAPIEDLIRGAGDIREPRLHRPRRTCCAGSAEPRRPLPRRAGAFFTLRMPLVRTDAPSRALTTRTRTT